MKGRYTQSQLASEVGVTQPTVQRWLSGAIPGGEELYKLCKLFGVDVDYFFGDWSEGIKKAFMPAVLRERPPAYKVDAALGEVVKMRECLAALEEKLIALKGKP